MGIGTNRVDGECFCSEFGKNYSLTSSLLRVCVLSPSVSLSQSLSLSHNRSYDDVGWPSAFACESPLAGPVARCVFDSLRLFVLVFVFACTVCVYAVCVLYFSFSF